MDVMTATTGLTSSNRWDHVQARMGYRRMQHIVPPGLYCIGAPSKASPVFVSANYTLSFDSLRSNLQGMDALILVLDTKGVNVWCAAGKGTFGTDELISKIRSSGLAEKVDHRRLILPQLGAPGVAAHVVKKETGFTVEYGPVRARDIPDYMRMGKVTPEMRTVTFPLRDRAELVPVEIVQSLKYLLPAMVLLFLAGGTWSMNLCNEVVKALKDRGLGARYCIASGCEVPPALSTKMDNIKVCVDTVKQYGTFA